MGAVSEVNVQWVNLQYTWSLGSRTWSLLMVLGVLHGASQGFCREKPKQTSVMQRIATRLPFNGCHSKRLSELSRSTSRILRCGLDGRG